MSFQSYRRTITVAFAAAAATLALVASSAPAVAVEQLLEPQSSQSACELWRDTHGTRPARPCGEAALASHRTGASTAALSATNAVRDESSDDGFDWGAAAIGAGTALVLMAIAAVGAFALSGRGTIRTAR